MSQMAIYEKYNLQPIESRPHVKVEKRLCLDGEDGEKIVKSEIQTVLAVHKMTFTRLGDM